MKVLIVFLGLLIVNVNLIGYYTELGRYIELQNTFKMASEECAAQAALLLDEEAYARGMIIFDYSAGEKDSFDYLENICHGKGIHSDYDVRLYFEDDRSAYSVGNKDRFPRVTATISVNVSSLFRTKQFENAWIVRSSCYEMK